MSLPWVRLDSTFPANVKVLQLIDAKKHRAINLYTFGLAWSGHQGTDGFIPTYALRMIHGTKADADALVEVGLWDAYDNGWRVHDWDTYQPNGEVREKVLAGLAKGRCTIAMNKGAVCICGQH